MVLDLLPAAFVLYNPLQISLVQKFQNRKTIVVMSGQEGEGEGSEEEIKDSSSSGKKADCKLLRRKVVRSRPSSSAEVSRNASPGLSYLLNPRLPCCQISVSHLLVFNISNQGNIPCRCQRPPLWPPRSPQQPPSRPHLVVNTGSRC